MANQFVQLAADGSGKRMQTHENTVGGQVVQAQAVVLTDTAGAPISTLPVSGPFTDAQLRAFSATLAQSALSSANAAVTATLPAAGVGLFHYITSIEITRVNPTATAIAASAATLAFTSTNLNGLAWTSGNALAAGANDRVVALALFVPIRSQVANTATTIVAPAIGAGGLVRIQVTYYTGP